MGEGAWQAAREMAADIDPAAAAARIGARFDDADQAIALPFLGSNALISWPDCDVTIDSRPAPSHVAALLVYHLALSDGTEPAGEWISFADLPEASFYVTAFNGYTGAQIARVFGPDGARLDEAAVGLGGHPITLGADRAWRIDALPRVPVALLWWDADEEFGARAQLLYDATASSHLTTDGCAVLGSWLTSMLGRGA